MTEEEQRDAMQAELDRLFDAEPDTAYCLLVSRPKPTGGSGVQIFANMDPKDMPGLLNAAASHALMLALDPPEDGELQ